jgi:transcriptional regulator with XRE-family HTH domain
MRNPDERLDDGAAVPPPGPGPTFGFATLLRGIRTGLGMSRLDVAARAGTSVGHLDRLENGRCSPGPRVLRGLLKAMRMPADVESRFLESAARSWIDEDPQPQPQSTPLPRSLIMTSMAEEEAAFFRAALRPQPLPTVPIEAPVPDTIEVNGIRGAWGQQDSPTALSRRESGPQGGGADR